MTAKEFLEDKNLTSVETVENLIINLVINDSIYGMEINTSGIPQGTPLNRTEDFQIEDDILTTGELSLDLSVTNMLGKREND
jgi:hypothetical protein